MRLGPILFITTFIAAGCASYAAPGRGANMRAIAGDASPADVANGTEPALRSALAKKPLASFPAAVAVARVQEAGYCSRTARGYGGGRYSVVTTRDVERPEHFDRLAQMPLIHGVAPVNRLLLPDRFQSDAELRAAAAALHADVLLIYTLDTVFRVDERAAPLTLVSLGLFPNRRAHVICTASAILLDTRNGYVYGVAEATDKADQLTSAWTTAEAVDASRLRAEERAFAKLMGELETTWHGVVAQYAVGSPSRVSGGGDDAAPGRVYPTLNR